MGTEKELNKVLSEIYSDLEKLQSAREQVEIVTENSRELTSATSFLVKELREFSNQFGIEYWSNISQLTKSLSDFEDKINKVSEKGNQSISEYIESFKKQIVGVIEQFSKQLSDNEENLKIISNLNNEKIANKIFEFEETTKDLKINTEKEIEEIITVAISRIEKQEQISSNAIVNIENNLNAAINWNNDKIWEKIIEFEKATTLLEINIEKGLEEIKTVAISTIENHEQISVKTIGRIENNINADINFNIEKIYKTIEKFEKATTDLKINVGKGIDEIKTVAINKIENQERIISKTIANIENTNLENKELISILTEYNIPKRLDGIDNKLLNQFHQSKLIKKLLIVVLSLIGLEAIVAIGLVVKFL